MRTACSLPYGRGVLTKTENPWTDTPWTENPSGQRYPWTETPCTVTPLDRDPPPGQRFPQTETSPWTETPWTETPRQRPPWTKTSPPGQRPPCVQSHRLRLRAVIKTCLELKAKLDRVFFQKWDDYISLVLYTFQVIFTARNRKVMFSRVSVSHSVHRGLSLVPCPFKGWVYLFPGPFPPQDTHPLQYWHLVAATPTRTVGKRAVRSLLECFLVTGADPGFPVGGGANPLGGRQHTILPNFPKNCMKLRKFWWSVGGALAGGAPLRSATVQWYFVFTAVRHYSRL